MVVSNYLFSHIFLIDPRLKFNDSILGPKSRMDPIYISITYDIRRSKKQIVSSLFDISYLDSFKVDERSPNCLPKEELSILQETEFPQLHTIRSSKCIIAE